MTTESKSRLIASIDIERRAAALLKGASDDVPGMRELVKRHVEAGVYVRDDVRFPTGITASSTYLDPKHWPAPRRGWVGFVRADLDRVAMRDALGWIVASVAFRKAGVRATHADEHALSRALTMPLGPFLEAAFRWPDAAELAGRFDVTIADVQARIAELAN